MSKIEWTEATWNPIVGCSIVSPGCTNCYAMRMAHRLELMSVGTPQLAGRYGDLTKVVNGNPVWTGSLRLVDRKLDEPLRRKKPTTYFVNSMGDLFHEDVPDEWIDRVFAVMALCPQHTFQVLTKRSARMWKYVTELCEDQQSARIEALCDAAVAVTGSPCAAHIEDVTLPLPNVWLGVSAERQKEADARIPDLLATPAAVRFVSAEPLLGPIDFRVLKGSTCLASAGSCCRGTTKVNALRGIQYCERAGAYAFPDKSTTPRGLDWIIVGGESGPGARPMHPEWTRSIRDQCAAADVPFFFKQWGQWRAIDDDDETRVWMLLDRHGGLDVPDHRWPDVAAGEVRVIRASKKQNGRTLDGRRHDDMPQRAGVR